MFKSARRQSILLSWIVFYWLAGFSCHRATAAAEPISVESSNLPITSLSDHLAVLVDSENRISLLEITQGAVDDRFVDNRQLIPSIGFTTATVWVRCRIDNRTNQDVSLVVESSMARLSHADWYLVEAGQVLKTVRSGAADLPSGTSAADQYPRIVFTAPALKQLDLYLCAESDTAIWLPLIIGSENQFKGFDRTRLIQELFLLSVCLMVSGISLFIGFSHRSRMYSSLAAIAFAYAMIFAVFNGHVRSMIPTLPLWWERQFYGAITVVGLLSLVSIDRRVFDLEAFPRWLARVRTFVILLLLATLILQLVLDYRLSAKYVFSIMGIGVLSYVLICVYAAITQRSWPTRILLAAWLVIITNFAVNQLSQAYIKPYTIQTLFLPAILLLFLIGLIQYQISLSQTQVRLSSALQAESEARLTALRAQLDPHFLFNSLNSIDALSRIAPSKVPELVERLAAFLRFRLESRATPYRKLIDELDALKAYLDIEKVRFGDQLNTTFEVQKETHYCQVPEMILQPLVENAIKHGFEVDKPVELTVKSRLLAGKLNLEVVNRFPVTPSETAEGGFGIGLSNTRDRLRHLYGDQANLQLTQEQMIFTVSLILPNKEGTPWQG